jgi:hypothetical protein
MDHRTVRSGTDTDRMDDIDARHRIGQARLLRRLGKTYAEIRTVVGPVRDETLAGWLRGIPRPAATYRSHAKTEVRRECRRLRTAGLTYDEIRAETGVSKASLSLWLRDLPVPARCLDRRVRQLASIAGSGPAEQRRCALIRRERHVAMAENAVPSLQDRELFVVGLALYWAEGTKDKPWNRNGRVVIINSDPTVLKVFLSWLDLVGVTSDRRSYRLSIHESADVADSERWWSETLQIPLDSFRRASLKRHHPLPSRHNVLEGYRGCLTVSVSRSRALYDAIDGWWRGVADSLPIHAHDPVPSDHLDPGSSNGRTSVFESENGGSTPPPGAGAAPWLPVGWWDTVGSVGG